MEDDYKDFIAHLYRIPSADTVILRVVPESSRKGYIYMQLWDDDKFALPSLDLLRAFGLTFYKNICDGQGVYIKIMDRSNRMLGERVSMTPVFLSTVPLTYKNLLAIHRNHYG